MKEQIILISGGTSFRNLEHALDFYKKVDIEDEKKYKSWKDWLVWSLEEKYDFIIPKMPTKDNAQYQIWKLMFEKYLAKLNTENTTIIAHSLGTIFILKYLVENGFSKKIKQLHLVSPIVSNDFQPADDVEDCGTFTFDIAKVNMLKNLCEVIHIWHSKDDEACEYANAEYLVKEIPTSIFHSFETRGHFSQQTFPELFDILRK